MVYSEFATSAYDIHVCKMLTIKHGVLISKMTVCLFLFDFYSLSWLLSYHKVMADQLTFRNKNLMRYKIGLGQPIRLLLDQLIGQLRWLQCWKTPSWKFRRFANSGSFRCQITLRFLPQWLNSVVSVPLRWTVKRELFMEKAGTKSPPKLYRQREP